MSLNPILVKEDVLDFSSQTIDYAVNMGGSTVSSQIFVSNSITPNSSTYVIQSPSLSCVINPVLLRHEEVVLTFVGTPDAGKYLINYGVWESLSPVPLANLILNTTVQINNASVAVQTQEIIDPLMRMMSRQDLEKINGTSPAYLDNYGNYTQTKNETNNPLSGYFAALDPYHPPRGSFMMKSMIGNTVQAAGGTAVKTVVITFEITEPLFVSPFAFSDSQDDQAGLVGINQINIVDQRDAQGLLVWRSSPTAASGQCAKTMTVSYNQPNCWIECQFITPHVSLNIPSQSISPYLQYNLFKTTAPVPVLPADLITVTSSSVMLNGIPDQVLIFSRNKLSARTAYTADSYGSIEKVSINFNNQNGILSNASQNLLWKFSQQSGSNLSWNEHRGQAYSFANDVGGLGLNSVATSTTGSVLALTFGRHIPIAEAFYSAGSQGSFNFSVTVQYKNLTGQTWTNPELCLLFINSGVVSCSAGTTSIFTNLLSKTNVLDAQMLGEPTTRAELRRLVGGGFFSNLKHIAKKAVKHLAPHVAQFAKEQLATSSHPLARLAEKGIEVAGYGMSAGGMSAGRMRKHLKM